VTEHKPITWLCAILFPIVMLLLFANALIFDEQTYRELLSPEAMPATLQLLDYFRGDAVLPGIFNEAEKAHLADVKRVIGTVQGAMMIFLAVFLALLPRADPQLVFTRGFLLLLMLLLLLPVFPFETVFVGFHKLFFEPGTWAFPAESTLIRYYPEGLFQSFFQRILTMTLVFSAVLALAGYSIFQHHKA
jgi:integral membrane protein (TIGR01906 family)